ncbi:MAG: hypothetical protein COV74_09360 [Candidatus Omnitrophica bacterium CG11_big_fil_rev_8_21_14_0_20_45_26]|uniref:FMN-binding domain-containing protein n=1 Tax=Candidatus Abzuiibacterium crystallinum TaxID=1974748 RepID=A0A2H0LLN1_9BACT|nr:MAG: hypothetical protein COV74_09360 [Candidatus Omnitrophica bacterium CG11_big_fil_rev_8_21_14_0_20_45_26]PIW65360.1 MAG: hypothetical protein COW12_02300 [Candidatus Omnitrophica bacterium CG12_big_fil_rev_8_21_14_0_65_45_16]
MAIVKRAAVSTVSLIAIFIFSPLTLVQNLWYKFALKQPVQISQGMHTMAYAEQLVTVEEALKAFMPDADQLTEDIQTLTEAQLADIEAKADLRLKYAYEKQHRFFIGKKDGQVIGYAAQDVVPGKWGPIYYMMLMTPEGAVQDVMVLAYEERRGRPVAKSRFLKQFYGKTVHDEIELMRDIKGITGASISSRGMTEGIRKMIHIFNVCYGKNQ